MVHIQNSTLAGGVAVGTSANLMLEPFGAVLVGVAAGAISVAGYEKITVSRDGGRMGPSGNREFNFYTLRDSFKLL